MTDKINIPEADRKNIESYLNNRKIEYRDAVKRLTETDNNLTDNDWPLFGTGNIVGHFWHGSLSLSCSGNEGTEGNQWHLEFNGEFYGPAAGGAELLLLGDLYQSPKALRGRTVNFQVAALGANIQVSLWDGPVLVGTVIGTGVGAGLFGGWGSGKFT
jgi:hypothetical protein